MIRQFTLLQLAAEIGATVDGDGGVVIERVATLDDADARAVTWVAGAKHMPRMTESRAAAFLTSPEIPRPDQRPALRAADVDGALVRLLSLLEPPPPRVAPGIHPTAHVAPDAIVDGAAIGPNAFVGPGARIGRGTQLHAGVYVGANTTVGADCVIWPNVVIRERITIGDRVIIHANCTIGADGFGYIFREGRHLKVPQIGTVLIEDDVEIGANTTVDRAKTGETRIGQGTKIDNLVQIGHNVTVGRHCIIVAQCGVSGSCTFGDYVIVGGQVGVADHVKVGAGTQIAARAALFSDVPAQSKVAGAPAMDAGDFWRLVALQRRLPDMASQLRELQKRVAQLESAAHNRTGS